MEFRFNKKKLSQNLNLGDEFGLSELEFGKFVSSSNQIVEDIVEIDVTDPIFAISTLQDSFGQISP